MIVYYDAERIEKIIPENLVDYTNTSENQRLGETHAMERH